MRAVFFQVFDAGMKRNRIVETAHTHFSKKESIIFFVEGEKARDFVDDLLWKLPTTSFLPHVVSEVPIQELIVITKSKINLNDAFFAFNLCSTPLLLPRLKIVYEFEDLSAPNKQNLSSLRFSAYKQAEFILESR